MVLDKLIIEPFRPLVVGKVYTLTIPNQSIGTKFGSVLPSQSYPFIYFGEQIEIDLIEQSVTNETALEVGENTFKFEYTYARSGAMYNQITVKDDLGNLVPIEKSLVDNVLSIKATLSNGTYQLEIPSGALSDNLGHNNEAVLIGFKCSK